MLLLGSPPASAQNAQPMPYGSIFFEPLTPPSTPKVHPYVPPAPPSQSASVAAAHASDGMVGISGSSAPRESAGARPSTGALLGYTTDCNAVSGRTASGRPSATTALDCVPVAGARHNQR